MKRLNVDRIKVIDEQERIFESVLSAEMRDNSGIIVSPEEVKKFIDTYIQERDGPMTEKHTNRVIGKVLSWREETIHVDEELLERAVEANPKNGSVRGVLERYLGQTIPVIIVQAKIHNHYEADTEVWNKLKSGEYTGVSFGGSGDDDKYDRAHDGIRKKLKAMWEVAVVDAPRVAIALLSGINDIAQSDDASALRSHCANHCLSCGADRGEIMQKEITQGRKYVKDPSQAPEGAKIQRGSKGSYYYEESGASATSSKPTKPVAAKPGERASKSVSVEELRKGNAAAYEALQGAVKTFNSDLDVNKQLQALSEKYYSKQLRAAASAEGVPDDAKKLLLAAADKSEQQEADKDRSNDEADKKSFETGREKIAAAWISDSIANDMSKEEIVAELSEAFGIDETSASNIFDKAAARLQEYEKSLTSDGKPITDTNQADALTTDTPAAHKVTSDDEEDVTEEFKKDTKQGDYLDEQRSEEEKVKNTNQEDAPAATPSPEPSPQEEVLQRLEAIEQRLTALETPAEEAEAPVLAQTDPGAQEGDKDTDAEVHSANNSVDESKNVAQRDRPKGVKHTPNSRPSNIAQSDKGIDALAIARGANKPSYAQIREEVF